MGSEFFLELVRPPWKAPPWILALGGSHYPSRCYPRRSDWLQTDLLPGRNNSVCAGNDDADDEDFDGGNDDEFDDEDVADDEEEIYA